MADTDSARVDSSSFPLRHDLFSALPDHARQLVLADAKRMSLRKGETLFSKGDRGDCAYYVRQGIIKISIGSPTGEQRIVAIHPTAVIDDPNVGNSAAPGEDVDFVRAGINAVLDQLLHDRRRPFDHFACRDLAGYGFGKQSDARHERR